MSPQMADLARSARLVDLSSKEPQIYPKLLDYLEDPSEWPTVNFFGRLLHGDISNTTSRFKITPFHLNKSLPETGILNIR